MIKNLINQGYKVLAEDADTLEFKQLNNISKEIENLRFYEIDHLNKIIYLEPLKTEKCILITTSDDLELPLAVVNNFNQAADFMNVTATHLYRADRHAGRPNVLAYNNFKLIKIFL